jgi:hypothetical protein
MTTMASRYRKAPVRRGLFCSGAAAVSVNAFISAYPLVQLLDGFRNVGDLEALQESLAKPVLGMWAKQGFEKRVKDRLETT